MAQYTYSERNNFLERLDYGNGDGVEYEYDQQGRVTSQTYEDGDTVTYRYDNNGALATVTDSATGRTTTYYYDFTNRLMKYVETGDVSHSVQYTYDEQNKLTKLVEVINGVTHTTRYTYDDDQRISSIQNGDQIISYTYDEYGRVSQKTDGIFTYVYTYKNTDAGAPTGQVATITVTGNSGRAAFRYTYDDNGNILSAFDNGLTNTYTYDSAGQLIRENNKRANKTWVWTYDDAGNILSKSEYAFATGTLGTPTDTIVYTYGDTDWGDLLTAYDGVTITYDEMGNPLSDGTRSYVWEHGRQLAAVKMNGTVWRYTYDANGMRTSRTNGTDTYSYVYNGSKLMQMTVGTNTLTFTYDGSGNPSTVTLNGTTYYYITNLQGDVIQIRTASGALVCNYSYDAWGNVVSASNYANAVLYSLNPLLYRGYVYDHETNLYYLQSRYYNPEIGRFINADVYTSTGQGVLGCNMFAYCGNNPANCSDPNGHKWRFWRVLFGDHRQGYIHWAVEAHIVLSGLAQKELVLPGVGRADIYNPETGEIWEIKYGGSSVVTEQENINKAIKQLETYLEYKKIPLHMGAAGAFKGEFVLNCGNYSYLITYDTPQKGVILYNFKILEERVENAFAVYPDTLPFAKKEDSKSYAWLLAFCIPSFGGGSTFDERVCLQSFT